MKDRLKRAARELLKPQSVRPAVLPQAGRASSRPVKIGVQLQPQGTTVGDLRAAWREADSIGVDSIWTWDHFFALYGPADADHFEGWTLLSAMAVETRHAQLGLLVGCNSYRNPDLLADMARTVDHLSGGRLYLGIGAGWFERDYAEYGYEFGTAGDRLGALGDSLERIRKRLAVLSPGPLGPLPVMVGGGGPKVTLKLTAQYADAWNTFGPPENFKAKNAILDDWCDKLGRDRGEIERTVAIDADDVANVGAYVDAGASHIIVMVAHPFDLRVVEGLLDAVARIT